MASTPSPEGRDSQLSYTYWVGKPGDNIEQRAPLAVPKKLSEAELAAVHRSQSPGSLWNQAGTWEERNLTEWAKERITEKMKFSQNIVLEGTSQKFSVSVKNCTIEATLVIVRNKKRHGYTLELKLGFEGSCSRSFKDSRQVKGSLDIPEFSCGEFEESEVQVTIDNSDSLRKEKRDALTRAMKPITSAIRQRLEEFEAELKER